MAPDSDLGPLPKRITGSCLCGKIAYQIDFPENHPWKDNVGVVTSYGFILRPRVLTPR
jgi:hypothetical protein